MRVAGFINKRSAVLGMLKWRGFYLYLCLCVRLSTLRTWQGSTTCCQTDQGPNVLQNRVNRCDWAASGDWRRSYLRLSQRDVKWTTSTGTCDCTNTENSHTWQRFFYTHFILRICLYHTLSFPKFLNKKAKENYFSSDEEVLLACNKRVHFVK